ncbi:hypothetical protein [Zhihengliuella sp.]|uniref:hypothetical protein n=1 Tax=Zhihengliuella sp. TaxID=1954483 RepID=UPI0028127C0C|nr:hypothetical protein [Zhihengliuella sp.]
MKDKLPDVILGPDGKPVAGVQGAILKALGVQRPLVVKYLDRQRRKHPGASAHELAALIERDYRRAVTGGGAAIGATAAVPGIGTVTSLSLSAAATVGFLEASALYAQSLAELHGISTEDPEKARVLVMAVIMGDEGSSLIASLTHQAAGRGAGPVQGWGSVFGSASQKGLWGGIASKLQKRFLRRLVATQGASTLGRVVPFGIGAAIGGVGNHLLAKKVIETAREAFATLPETIPADVIDGRPAAPGADRGLDPSAEVEREIEAERRRRAGESD